ncbi:VOC family protein [Hyphomicrobium sp.]|uniref:VOC family protein n=1 Tax=Hyphomicrobium sp. TaxID=82 RepID=UPI002BF383D2|nr:VOC family protein [Hyphomicrobium sp.]HRN88431.1 VOC family protein [Hyphomicrobium sp.]HRQ26582.1 VOC family protein [Hyphomicrobium sp.]
MPKLQKITPYFWFDDNAEDAVTFYVSLFDDARITGISRYGKDAPMPEGTALVVSFELAGQQFAALNGGPTFKLSEAASLFVGCDTQAEIDRLWSALSEEGTVQPCGWVKDRFGLSWQINWSGIADVMSKGTAAQQARMMGAMMQMQKVDLAALERAVQGV